MKIFTTHYSLIYLSQPIPLIKPVQYGRLREICGMYVTSNNERAIMINIGTMYLVTPSIFTLATPQPTNKHEPTGGVTEPIPRFMINIKPKCTSLIPIRFAIGRKIGTKINTAGVRSKNIPITSKNTFMIKRIT